MRASEHFSWCWCPISRASLLYIVISVAVIDPSDQRFHWKTDKATGITWRCVSGLFDSSISSTSVISESTVTSAAEGSPLQCLALWTLFYLHLCRVEPCCQIIKKKVISPPLFFHFKVLSYTGETNMEVRPFFCFHDELAIKDNIIMKGSMAVIPTSLHSEYLKVLHKGHFVESTKRRTSVFWPSVNYDMNIAIQTFNICNSLNSPGLLLLWT